MAVRSIRGTNGSVIFLLDFYYEHIYNWPVSSFFTIGYTIAARALYKLFERRRKSALRLHASCLSYGVDALHKLPKKLLVYLFVKKLLTGRMDEQILICCVKGCSCVHELFTESETEPLDNRDLHSRISR